MNAWLTPDAPDGSTVRRVLVIPLSYLPAVNGALEELTNAFNWEEFGDQTPDEAAAEMFSLVEAYYVSEFIEGAFPTTGVLPINNRSSGNAVSWTQDNAQYNAGVWGFTTVAVNNAHHWYLPAKTGAQLYIGLVGQTGTAQGIPHLKVDGHSSGTLDMYTAGFVRNKIGSIGPYTFITDGIHDIELIVDSHNASATNYGLLLSEVSYRIIQP